MSNKNMEKEMTSKGTGVQAEERRAEGRRPGKKAGGTVFYIGPPIPGTVSANAVFNNGVPQSLLDAAKDEPAISVLIVPLERLAQSRQAVNRKNTPEAVCYEKAVRYAGKKGAGK